MRVTRTFTETLMGLLLVLGAARSVTILHAQAVSGTIQVRGLTGSATYTAAGSAPMPLHAGAVLPIGSVVKTETGGAVDLSFSHNAGVIRLLQNSTLSLDKFTAPDATAGTAVEIQLYLMEGTMAGFEKNLPSASQYQVKVPNGIADIGGSKYRINAQGYLVLLDGNALFVLVPAGGEPMPFQMKASSPMYFSPVEFIKPAPAELVREIVLQTKGKLQAR